MSSPPNRTPKDSTNYRSQQDEVERSHRIRPRHRQGPPGQDAQQRAADRMVPPAVLESIERARAAGVFQARGRHGVVRGEEARRQEEELEEGEVDEGAERAGVRVAAVASGSGGGCVQGEAKKEGEEKREVKVEEVEVDVLGAWRGGEPRGGGLGPAVFGG